MKPSWTFARGFLLGAGLMYFIDPSADGRPPAPASWPRPLQLLAAAAGAVAVAYGARRAFVRARSSGDEQRLTPNYAYLR